jgi:hypothetical protein
MVWLILAPLGHSLMHAWTLIWIFVANPLLGLIVWTTFRTHVSAIARFGGGPTPLASLGTVLLAWNLDLDI